MLILITGGAGNIASALASSLAEDVEKKIVIVDDLSTGSLSKIPQKDNVKFIKCDVNDRAVLAPIFKGYAFDYVFHYAAVVGVQRTLANPLAVLDDIEGIKNILTLSHETGVKRVFYSSSSEVYGEPFEVPQNEETTPLNSRLPYAVVKNVGEVFFKSFQQVYGLDYTIFRFFNTYGPHQSDDFVVPLFLKMALQGQDISIYGDGLQTRSFCYVDDNVETCVRVMNDDAYVNEVINVGSDKEQTVLSLAEKIIEITRSKSRIVFQPPLPEGDMTRRCPDNARMRTILNRDLMSLDDGILRMMDFLSLS